MKNILSKLLFIFIITFTWSCNNLDIQPLDTLTDEQIYSNSVGVNSALQSMYMQLPIGTFAARNNTLIDGVPLNLNTDMSSVYIGEVQKIPLRSKGTDLVLEGQYFQWWNYVSVRYCNIGIEEIKKHYDDFSSNRETYNHWLGEAYFCRAYNYYVMVRSFGGVPIVRSPKSYIDYPSLESLQIHRNTEKEVVDFIAADLDSAMVLMKDKEIETGRANKYVAANLKARVMLFAAAEAKNGQVQLNGLVGIPASDAKEYYKKAYAAAQFVIDGGKYGLYRKFDNKSYMGKVKNYEQLFIDESPANNERMFVIQFDQSIASGHCWDSNQRPLGYTVQLIAGELSATLEWVEMFDDVDGNSGKLNIGDPNSPIRYSNPADLFTKVQPRLRASVLLPGVQFPGSENPSDIYEIRKGIYESYPNGSLHTSTNHTDKYNGMFVQGKCGMGDVNVTDNGFIVWKYQNPSATGAFWSSYQDWIDMRYAEVLLNKAEAAVNIIGETVDGKVITMQDALEPINDIRDRAGTAPLTTIDEAKVINERRCELAFENLLIWDMKRWRMLENVLQGKTFSSLYPFYVANESKYIFLKKERTEIKYRFDAKAYYAPLPAASVQKNPNLLPNNPGY